MFTADAINSVDRCGRQNVSALVIVIPKQITPIQKSKYSMPISLQSALKCADFNIVDKLQYVLFLVVEPQSSLP